MLDPQGPQAPSILALDLSLVHPGLCLDGTTWVLTTKPLRGEERLAFIVDEATAYLPDEVDVYIEGYAYGAHSRAVTGLAELGGCVRLALFRLGHNIVEVPPATLKKWATGYGNANKQAMLDAAWAHGLPRTIKDDNEADAYLLWCYALARRGGWA